MSELIFTEDLDTAVLERELDKQFSKGETIAVKLHYGEPGNKTSLGPEYAKTIVDVLKKIGCRPFLFDSSVVYPSPRKTVEGHKKSAEVQGFTEMTIGCPIIFTDDSIPVKTEYMEMQVCKPLKDADGMIVLTHTKGHACGGMGGAIKNLGMGGVSRETKGAIHEAANAQYVEGCTQCKICEKVCSMNFIKVTDKPEFNSCFGCGACIDNCPAGALTVKEYPWDTLISASAKAVIEDQKVFYINILKNITPKCDCWSNPGKPVVKDIGVLYGTDIVSIDKASIDMINNKAGRDIFKELYYRSAMTQVVEAERLSMGKLQYKVK